MTFSAPDRLAVWTIGKSKPVILRTADIVSRGTFRGDGKAFATWGNLNGSVTVWSPSGSRSVLSGHKCPLTGAFFSPDGKKLLTIAGDHTAILWKVNQSSGDGVPDILYASCGVAAAGFYADGSHVVTACQEGGVQTWMTQPRAVQSFLTSRTKACIAADRRMTILGETPEAALQEFNQCERGLGR